MAIKSSKMKVCFSYNLKTKANIERKQSIFLYFYNNHWALGIKAAFFLHILSAELHGFIFSFMFN